MCVLPTQVDQWSRVPCMFSTPKGAQYRNAIWAVVWAVVWPTVEHYKDPLVSKPDDDVVQDLEREPAIVVAAQ